jgi:hypothetical protein
MLAAMRPAASAMLIGSLVIAAIPAGAQDLEPKAYSASPVGANFLVMSYNWASGNVLFDPTLPITDVKARVQALVVGVGHSFNLFGDLGLVTVGLPAGWLAATGNVYEQAASVTRSGLGDARLKLSVNLRGNPAAPPSEFARRPRQTIVGASITATAPTGQYDDTKLINIGTNRWAFKPEVGVSWPKGPWDVDGYVGTWFFTANQDFFPRGQTRTQDPVLAIQGHVSYTMQPRLWVAVDGTWYHGGSSVVDGGPPSTPLSNSRIGITASLPAGKRYSLKLAYGQGAVVRTGTDFKTIAIAWQALWLSPRWSGR